MHTCKLEILVHPSFSEPKLNKDDKPHGKQKYRFPWRIKKLAKPKPPVATKYQPPPPTTFKVYGKLDPVTEFYSDQNARPTLKLLNSNKKMYKDMGPIYLKRINANIEKTWDSIYNFYNKKLRAKRLLRLRRKLAKLEAKKPKGKDLEKMEALKAEWLVKIATPKKPPEPPEIPKKYKPLDELAPYLDVLAVPKEYHILPPVELGRVNPRALTYEMTPEMIKLAEQVPQRLKKNPSDDVDHWAIKKSALTYRCTPAIEKLAQPSLSAREARKNDEDKFDPWAIPPNVLKYKATPRILELAKPVERE